LCITDLVIKAQNKTTGAPFASLKLQSITIATLLTTRESADDWPVFSPNFVQVGLLTSENKVLENRLLKKRAAKICQ